jgi:hypothetical protein
VLIGESTYRLVRGIARVEPVTAVEAKGKSDPVVAYRLLDLEAPAVRSPGARTPLVGRDRELGWLMRDSKRSCRSGRAGS